MADWTEFKLGSACTKIGSGATPRGGGDTYLAEGKYALVRSQNVLDFEFSHDGLAYISEEQADRLKNVSLEKRDVLLNITGDSVARVCQVPNTVLPARVNQHVAILRPDKRILNPEYLKYYLLSPSFKNFMLSIASVGATRNAITKGMIEDFTIKAPNLIAQTAIAEILTSLDDKVQLNNKINKNLEALAQTLFKQWFIDFEFPNENNQPYKSSGGVMVESELGKIPQEWRVGKLGDVVKILNGYAFKSKDFKDQGTHGVLKIKNINGSIVDIKNTQYLSDEIILNLQDKFKVNAGDVLIAMTGAEVGKTGVVPKTDRSIWLNQRVGKFSPIIERSLIFARTIFDAYNFTEQVRNSAMGSAQPNISSAGIEGLKCVNPPIRLIKYFSEVLSESYALLLNNLYENAVLEQIRENLLPKLMTGQLEIEATNPI